MLAPLFFLLCLVPLVHSAPFHFVPREDAPALLPNITDFSPFTQFARAAYCSPEKLTNWTCGEACSYLAEFEPSLVGGDGNTVQIYFVGYWPSQNSVVVAHEGTDPFKLMSDLTDINLFQGPLDSDLFPGLPEGIAVHSGFRDEHAITAPIILTEVQRLLTLKNATDVISIGHSLGGALAQLDSLFLTLHLPSTVNIKSVTYGTPRVGNPAYANFFDSKVLSFRRINNEKDIVPIVPAQFLNFTHPQGEIHILSDKVVACPGNDDDTDPQCTVKSVPTILEGNLLNHLGPYGGIFIGTPFCT